VPRFGIPSHNYCTISILYCKTASTITAHLHLNAPAQSTVVQYRDFMATLYLNAAVVNTTRLQGSEQQLNIHHL
jgi:hypothetical protein